MIPKLKKLAKKIPTPSFTRPRNRYIWDWLNLHGESKKILNLGSGVGRFDHYLNPSLNMINIDINMNVPGVQVVADAHYLPFANDTFDIVYSIAVLEHVAKTWIVAEEIRRVLKPHGYVVLELPFLNVIHDTEDYFRFTDKGILSLFDEKYFDTIYIDVGSGGGSFLSVFMYEYFAQFFPGDLLKFLWRGCTSFILPFIKYLDIFIDKSRQLRVTANSFAYIGRKK